MSVTLLRTIKSNSQLNFSKINHHKLDRIGSCGEPWPIYMGEKPIEMEPGDAVTYLGCDIWHERKPFKGDWHAQSFMHYVDKNGPHADEVMDRRQFFCMPGVR